ncbi:hypothetical protein [Histidinibacterium lentulum]|nr:hypothetical protein [Histidinibacterium lentulum]
MSHRSDSSDSTGMGPLRRVAVGVLSGLQPRRETAEVAAWLDDQTPGRRNAIVAGVLGGLLAGALLFGAFGWIGMLVYLLIVIFLVN